MVVIVKFIVFSITTLNISTGTVKKYHISIANYVIIYNNMMFMSEGDKMDLINVEERGQILRGFFVNFFRTFNHSRRSQFVEVVASMRLLFLLHRTFYYLHCRLLHVPSHTWSDILQFPVGRAVTCLKALLAFCSLWIRVC